MLTSTANQSFSFGLTQLPMSLCTANDLYETQSQPQTPVLAALGDFDRGQAVSENVAIVRFIARQIHARLPQQVELEELISAGNLGLVDAATKFQGSKKVQFRSYAQFRIRGAILDSLRATDWSPRSLRRQGRAMEEAVCALNQRGMESPSDVHIAEEMGLDLPAYQHLLGELKGLEVESLQLERNSDTGEQEISLLAGPAADDPLFRCLQGEMRERLVAAIDTLPEKQRLVLSLYYYEELTMREVAHVMGVVESRVSQMHASALLRLRASLRLTSEGRVQRATAMQKDADSSQARRRCAAMKEKSKRG